MRGDIEATIDLHIDGRVHGDVSCAALVQGAESRIAGQIVAKSARIAGLVEGSIVTDELIVEGSKAPRYSVAGNLLAATHWNKAELRAPMINPENGELLRPAISDLKVYGVYLSGLKSRQENGNS